MQRLSGGGAVRYGVRHQQELRQVVQHIAVRRFNSRGLRIVSVSPGSISTDMGGPRSGQGPARWSRTPSPALGKPEEMAELLAFCASDKAGYLTGTDILNDGAVIASMTEQPGWLPRPARSSHHIHPDDEYAVAVASTVTGSCRWRSSVASDFSNRSSRAMRKSGNATLIAMRTREGCRPTRTRTDLRASMTIKIATARPNKKMSAAIDRDAGSTFVGFQNPRKLPPERRKTMFCPGGHQGDERDNGVDDTEQSSGHEHLLTVEGTAQQIANCIIYYLRMNAHSWIARGSTTTTWADRRGVPDAADPTRLQVLWALVDRELSVNELAEFVGKPAPSVSQHLAKLRMARLVRTRRAGTTITTASRTSMSGNWSAMRCSRRTRRARCPAHHRGDVASLTARKASR